MKVPDKSFTQRFRVKVPHKGFKSRFHIQIQVDHKGSKLSEKIARNLKVAREVFKPPDTGSN